MREAVICIYTKQSSQSHCMLPCAGDEILEVNGESLQGLTHQQAIQTFKVGCMLFKIVQLHMKRWSNPAVEYRLSNNKNNLFHLVN